MDSTTAVARSYQIDNSYCKIILHGFVFHL